MRARLFFFISVCLIADPFPAESREAWLVFRPGETRCHMIWKGAKPEPGKQVPEGSTVVQATDGKAPTEFVLDEKGEAKHQPEARPPKVSDEQKASRKVVNDLKDELDLAAVDPKVTDEQYQKLKTKLERAQKGGTGAPKGGK